MMDYSVEDRRSLMFLEKHQRMAILREARERELRGEGNNERSFHEIKANSQIVIGQI